MNEPSTFAAADMVQPAWMADRVADMARAYASDSPRICATLWWYSASAVLVDSPIRVALSRGTLEPVEPSLDGASCFLIPGGYLGGITYRQGSPSQTTPSQTTASQTEVDAVAAGLVAMSGPLIDALSEVSGATTRSLWAITTDSIANRALDAVRTLDLAGADASAEAFATALVNSMRRFGAVMPVPRFVDTTNGLFTRRASCCLIYETAGAHKCRSCPRRTPADRLARLNGTIPA